MCYNQYLFCLEHTAARVKHLCDLLFKTHSAGTEGNQFSSNESAYFVLHHVFQFFTSYVVYCTHVASVYSIHYDIEETKQHNSAYFRGIQGYSKCRSSMGLVHQWVCPLSSNLEVPCSVFGQYHYIMMRFLASSSTWQVNEYLG